MLAQQSHGQPDKAVAQKTKGTKLKQNSASLSYSIEQGREDKCWRYDGLHRKNDFPNPPQANICNVNPNRPCSYYKVYGHDENHYFTLHLELRQG